MPNNECADGLDALHFGFQKLLHGKANQDNPSEVLVGFLETFSDNALWGMKLIPKQTRTVSDFVPAGTIWLTQTYSADALYTLYS